MEIDTFPLLGRDNDFVWFLLVIQIFIGYYALFVLFLHRLKTGLYAYFKSHHKDWNNRADREEMEKHIAQNNEQFQKKAQKEAMNKTPKNAISTADSPKVRNDVEWQQRHWQIYNSNVTFKRHMTSWRGSLTTYRLDSTMLFTDIPWFPWRAVKPSPLVLQPTW